MQHHIFTFFILTLLSFSFSTSAKSLSIGHFLKSSEMLDMDVSPQGKYLATVWYKDKKRLMTVQDISQKDSPITAYYSDKVIRPSRVRWASDTRLLVTMSVPAMASSVTKKYQGDKEFKASKHEMFERVIAMDWDGKNHTALLNDKGSLRSNRSLSSIIHMLPDDPEHVLMPLRAQKRLTVFKVNIYKGTSEKIETGIKRTVRFAANSQGLITHRIDYLRVSKVLNVFRKVGDDWQLQARMDLYPDDDESAVSNFTGLTPDGGLVFKRTNEQTGYVELQVDYGSEKSASTLVGLKNKDVLGALKNRNGIVIGYFLEEDEVVREAFLDAKLQAIYDRLKSTLLENGFASFRTYSKTDDLSYILVKTNGQDDSGHFIGFDADSGRLDLYGKTRPSLPVAKLAKPANITYLTRDKHPIKAYMLFPPQYKKGSKFPLVVMPHGGPWARDFAHFNSLAQFIATRGYIVVRPNYRGSSGYGRDFEQAGYRNWGARIQEDIEDAVKFLVKKNYADANRVCIVGGSFGGYSALQSLVKSPDTYSCAVGMNGVYDLIAMRKYDNQLFSEATHILEKLERALGHVKRDRIQLQAFSPSKHASKVKAPVLLIAGTKDKRVPIKQSATMYKALVKAKKEVKFIKLEDATHHLTKKKTHKRKVYREIDIFLKENI